MEMFNEVLLKKRTLLLSGEITKEKIDRLRDSLFFLSSISKKEIKLIIDTRGGDVVSALKFHDAIKISKAPVICIVDGECSSSGIAILQAAQRRLMTEHSFIYLHPISIYFEKNEFSLEGIEEKFMSRLQATKIRQKYIYDIIMKRSGLTLEEIKEKEGKIIFAHEAKRMNLIDEIV